MRPTLRQLQYITAIADTGRFGEAAKLLNVSQPSLSAQVADLEGQLGVLLVERGRSGALMTPAGEEVVRRARLILRDVAELKASAGGSEHGLSGRLRLGVLPTIGPYLLPLVTREMHRSFPQLRLSVREERTVDLDTHLNNGGFDTVISTAEDHPDTQHAPLFWEKLYICAPPEDRLAKTSGPVSLQELAGHDLLTLGQGHRLDAIIRRIAETAGARVSHEYEGTSLDAIRQMAEMGAGVAILPSLYALTEARRDPLLAVRQIDDPIASRCISLIWRDTSPLQPGLRLMAQILARAAGNLLQHER
jgi:LysR family hydrogen peroxide-inducible transcriptional activator